MNPITITVIIYPIIDVDVLSDDSDDIFATVAIIANNCVIFNKVLF